MDEQMTKTRTLELMQSEREAFERLLGELSDQQMTRSGVENSWSVKDILAHITEWERLMVQWIQESVRGEVPQRPAPGTPWDDLDGLNQQIYVSNQDRTLDEILTDFHGIFQLSLQTVQALTEEDLVDPQRFTWRAGVPLWHLVADNTWEHYREHADAISKWQRE
jgi:hypothetical protein